ncbi:FAD-binding oxidoreductase [Acrocarpospora catenulata]|uniref:FAD-binding oxidoreductase n=1 Tax=Acrocarpospora catenulata TaxID=2836182 RepID=UPI001BD9DDC4|nr:FAD-binding oxidoreductase [Acrocarpospora catenulata]
MADEALASTGVTLRPAGAQDAVAGVRPRWVALPESTEEVAALLRVAAERDLAVVPVGGGTKLDWGPPPERCDLLVDLCCLSEVVEHVAGDLVLRVQAGITLETLRDRLAIAGQELALDVPVPGTTVGGLLATALAGPRRFRYGTARDLLIGITVVLADGTVARSGGKVVKNVAGYDLGKLFTGSYGTLGVITEANFRLHPLPPERRWVTAEYGTDVRRGRELRREFPVDPGPLLQELAASQAEPTAIELDWADSGDVYTLSVLVEGAAAEERAEAVRAIMTGAELGDKPPAWWGRLPEHVTLAEIRVPPGVAGQAVREVAGADLPGRRLRGSAGAGVFHLGLRDGAGVTGIRARLAPLGGRVTVLAGPDGGADRWGPIGALGLMRRVKERFDPDRRMSPGRFAGGI